jgi:hypothetical protein
LVRAPEVVSLAKKGQLGPILDRSKQGSGQSEFACIKSAGISAEFAWIADTSQARPSCPECSMLEICVKEFSRSDLRGRWAHLSSLKIGNRHETDGELARLAHEMDSILNGSPNALAEQFGVDARTVARWRKLLNESIGSHSEPGIPN